MKSIFTNVRLEHQASMESKQRKLKASSIPEEKELQKMLKTLLPCPQTPYSTRGTCRTKNTTIQVNQSSIPSLQSFCIFFFLFKMSIRKLSIKGAFGRAYLCISYDISTCVFERAYENR